MYIQIHIRIYINIYIYRCLCLWVSVSASASVSLSLSLSLSVCVCLHARMRARLRFLLCLCVCVCVRKRARFCSDRIPDPCTHGFSWQNKQVLQEALAASKTSCWNSKFPQPQRPPMDWNDGQRQQHIDTCSVPTLCVFCFSPCTWSMVRCC